MGKMDFSTFKDDTEVIKAVDVEVLDPIPARSAASAVGKAGTLAAGALSGLSPAAIIGTLIEPICGTLSDIGRCIASVEMEKQRTRQIQAQAEAQIEESVQQTKRVEIQEKEATNRVLAQCKARLQEREAELRNLCERNRLRETQLNQNHTEYLKTLEDLSKAIDAIICDKEALRRSLPDTIDSPQAFQIIFQELNELNAHLVKVSEQIVNLRRG